MDFGTSHVLIPDSPIVHFSSCPFSFLSLNSQFSFFVCKIGIIAPSFLFFLEGCCEESMKLCVIKANIMFDTCGSINMC